MKKRVVGYDIIKSMAMFFVVMLHYSFYTRFYSSGLAGTAVTVLCVVCVPLFFAVNGALLLPRKMDEAKHYRKTLNIVIVSPSGGCLPRRSSFSWTVPIR